LGAVLAAVRSGLRTHRRRDDLRVDAVVLADGAGFGAARNGESSGVPGGF